MFYGKNLYYNMGNGILRTDKENLFLCQSRIDELEHFSEEKL
jgi:hypothetical protein